MTGEITRDMINGTRPAAVRPRDITTIARMNATRLSGQPTNRPAPGIGTTKSSQARPRQIHVAATDAERGAGVTSATVFMISPDDSVHSRSALPSRDHGSPG